MTVFKIGLVSKILMRTAMSVGVFTSAVYAEDLTYSSHVEQTCATSAYGCEVDCGDTCGNECGDVCGCESNVGFGSRLGNLLDFSIQKSDCCFSNFISPMTNPTLFEDPRTLTEVRGIFLNHKFTTATGGGNLQLYALQARVALSEDLSLIATKDGYVVSTNPLIDDGFADVALGLKYNIYKNRRNKTIVSTGVMYKMPFGRPRTRQGTGDGTFNLFVSGAKKLGCRLNGMSSMGVVLPVDTDAESTLFFWSNHLDYKIGQRTYFVTELNWYNWLASGAGGVPGVEGSDLFNLGSSGVTGNDIVTAALGLKYKPKHNIELGAAWEFPLTARRDVLETRITVDMIYRY